MSALVAIVFLLGAAPAPASPASPAARPELSSLKGLKSSQPKLHAPVEVPPAPAATSPRAGRRCASTTTRPASPAWAARAVACKACHPVDFEKPVARARATCHRDPHGVPVSARAARLTTSCAGAAFFNADAHRKNRFPLLGGHAVIPCQTATPSRERRFAGPSVDCGTATSGPRPHRGRPGGPRRAFGFTAACEQCHGLFTFAGSCFLAHDLSAFPILPGPHAAVGCGTCHTGFPPPNTNGACNTRTAACTNRHEHEAACRAARWR